MADFWLLLKVQILKFFTGGKKSKNANMISKGRVFKVLAMFAIFIGMSFWYSFMYADMLSTTGDYNLLIDMFLISYLLISVFYGIYDSVSNLFGYKDYDFLAALPIKRWKVVLSKLSFTYLFDLGIAIILLIPAKIVCSIKTTFVLTEFLYLTVLCIFLPLLPLALTLVFGILVKLIFSSSKRKKFLETIFTLLFVAGLMALYISGGESMQIYSIMEKLPVVNWFVYGITNPLYMLAFVGVMVAVGITVVALISTKYDEMHARLTREKTRNDYKIKRAEKKGVMGSLIKKEYSVLLGIPVYAMNVLIGVFMCIFICLVIVVSLRVVLQLEFIHDLIEGYTPYVLGAMIFIAGVCPMSSASVSLEGKSFEVLKSLPVSKERIIASKLIASIIISLLSTVPAVLILVIGFRLKLLISIMLCITSITSAIMVSTVGLILGIKLAKFDWETPTWVVKQSGAAGLTLLANTILGVGILALTHFLLENISAILTLTLLTLLICLLTVALLWILFSFGIKAFKKL